MTRHNYIDFSVDENGLWLIYGLEGGNNTAVVKLEPNSLKIELAWNISLRHTKVGELFIVCGVLYAVEDVKNRTTNIRFGFDLYEGKLLEDVNLQFSNPFVNSSSIGYNPRTKELYTWDGGNRLTYPIRYKIRTYVMEEPDDIDNEVQNKTDVEIFNV
uniref:Olfactomedin-like domain-containing protein n=2 Tax=Clastoptera arizonana TaxID=38151 RepID=A0A1B6D982_9HEMI